MPRHKRNNPRLSHLEAAPEGDKGRFRIAFDKYHLGTINGGGPEFVLKTMRGDILIRKAK